MVIDPLREEKRKKRRIRKRRKAKRAAAPKKVNWSSFYRTEQWAKLRYDALLAAGGSCMLCGDTAHDGAKLQVDHIVPISKAPALKADPGNLQVL